MRSQLYIFKSIGILMIFICNAVVYLYQCVVFKLAGKNVPNHRTIFLIPDALDYWLGELGFGLFFVLLLGDVVWRRL